MTLAALFSLDSFVFVQSLLALWLFDHFGLSLTAAGSLFFWSGNGSVFETVATKEGRQAELAIDAQSGIVRREGDDDDDD